MKTTAQFIDAAGLDAGLRSVRIHLSRSGAPFALVFGGVSWHATGYTGVWSGDVALAAPAGTRMYEMRAANGERLMVDAAGAYVHLQVGPPAAGRTLH